jgi:LmbE family N-acetylglucosaminyl deacetylase
MTGLNIINRDMTVLVLAPHTDDEFGCAGTVIRLIENCAKVYYYALSRCEESVPKGLPRDILVGECKQCVSALGIPEENVKIGEFKVRHFPRDRQEILESLVKLNRELKPDLVLLPSNFDKHQDHHTVSEEGFRAFKYSTILGYELPQNLISFNNSAFVSLTEEQLEQKIIAISTYKSQDFRNYSREEFVRGLAKVRGVQCNVTYAEAFEVVRLIIK